MKKNTTSSKTAKNTTSSKTTTWEHFPMTDSQWDWSLDLFQPAPADKHLMDHDNWLFSLDAFTQRALGRKLSLVDMIPVVAGTTIKLMGNASYALKWQGHRLFRLDQLPVIGQYQLTANWKPVIWAFGTPDSITTNSKGAVILKFRGDADAVIAKMEEIVSLAR